MAATPQQLVNAAACYTCIDDPLHVPAMIYLLNAARVAQGGAVMTTQQLVNAAECYSCIDAPMNVTSKIFLLSQFATP